MTNNTTSTTTKKLTCHNVFEDLIDGSMIKYHTFSQIELFAQTLTKGIVSTNCNKCCPGCGDVYFLGGASYYAPFTSQYFNVLNPQLLTPENKLPCCLNIAANPETVETYLTTPIQNNEAPDYTLCTSGNFNSCLQQLQNILSPEQYAAIIDIGIVEYSNIAGKSMLCTFISQIQKSPVYSANLLYDTLLYILAYRTVSISCIHPFIFGGSYDKLITLLIALEGGPGGIGSITTEFNQPISNENNSIISSE
jgi:hypothetical protein